MNAMTTPEPLWKKHDENILVNRNYPLFADEFLSTEFVNELQKLRKSTPLPSGIRGFRLNPNDHIFYFVDTDSRDYISHVVDFLVSGVEDPFYREICTLETGEGWNKEELVQLVSSRTPYPYSRNLDIITYDIGYEPYISDTDADKQPFVPNTMQEIFFDEMYQARQNFHPTPDKCVRIASEDSGHFLRGLSNPREYLKYEGRLANDLAATFRTAILQLCVYRISDISAIPDELNGQISVNEILLRLLATHNRFLVTTSNGSIISERAAKHYIMEKIQWNQLPMHLYPMAMRVRYAHR